MPRLVLTSSLDRPNYVQYFILFLFLNSVLSFVLWCPVIYIVSYVKYCSDLLWAFGIPQCVGHSLYGSTPRGPEDDSVESKPVALLSYYTLCIFFLNLLLLYLTDLHPFFFSWRYNPHWGFVFYSPLVGFSLLACEVSWSHTTTRHIR